MGGTRKSQHSGKLFRAPTNDAVISGKIDRAKCALRLRTRLVSVRTADATILVPGAVFPVVLHQLSSGPVAVVAHPRTREPIGSLFPPEIDLLILCLENGFEYSAKIVEVNGADILVEVALKRS
jgi:hypothetical protein